MRYKVTNDQDGVCQVEGLPARGYPTTLLLYRYPEGDADYPQDSKQMHSALYDLYQCHDDLKEGDIFETPFGEFICRGVHVVRHGEGA